MLTEWLRQKINNAYDDIVQSHATIDVPHKEIHEGNSYWTLYSNQLNAGGTIEVRVQTPNTDIRGHMVITLRASLYFVSKIWTPTTKTDVVGNRLTPINRNMNSTNTSALTICYTPAGAQAGNPTWPIEYVGSASTSGKSDSGGESYGRHEINLLKNTSFLLHVLSGANANACSIVLDWYEES